MPNSEGKRPPNWEERIARNPELPKILRAVYARLLQVAERHNLVVYLTEERGREGESGEPTRPAEGKDE